MTPEAFFETHPQVAVALSGGTDSAYLLYLAARYAGRVRAYFVFGAFQTPRDAEDARAVCRELSVGLTVVPVDVLAVPAVVSNPADRCYHCKKLLFTALRTAAERDGFQVLLDGTNASDDLADRPGMRALAELGVLSPLRLFGLTKTEIRARAHEAGLPVWDKPAAACLATRIPTGEVITSEKLAAVREAEEALALLGFSDFRVRRGADGGAKIQICREQFPLALEKRRQILRALRGSFSSVVLDLGGRDE